MHKVDWEVAIMHCCTPFTVFPSCASSVLYHAVEKVSGSIVLNIEQLSTIHIASVISINIMFVHKLDIQSG